MIDKADDAYSQIIGVDKFWSGVTINYPILSILSNLFHKKVLLIFEPLGIFEYRL